MSLTHKGNTRVYQGPWFADPVLIGKGDTTENRRALCTTLIGCIKELRTQRIIQREVFSELSPIFLKWKDSSATVHELMESLAAHFDISNLVGTIGPTGPSTSHPLLVDVSKSTFIWNKLPLPSITTLETTAEEKRVFGVLPTTPYLDYANIRTSFRANIIQHPKNPRPKAPTRVLDAFQAAVVDLFEPPDSDPKNLGLKGRWMLNRQLIQASPGSGKTPILYCIVNKFVLRNLQIHKADGVADRAYLRSLYHTLWISTLETQAQNLDELIK